MVRHLSYISCVNSQLETEELSDIAYAKYFRYMLPAPVYKSKLLPPTSDINRHLYLVDRVPYDPSKPPFTYECFDRQRHVYPDVLWFQPNSKNPSAINYSLMLGLLIEPGEIDAVCIPILIEFVNKFCPSANKNNRFRLMTRTLNADDTQPIATAFHDASTVMVPSFGTEHIHTNIENFFGINIVPNCNDPEIDFTYAAWNSSTAPSLLPNYTYLWSSYRYVSNSNSKNRRVHFYYTLCQFYGENVTLFRTRNPVLMLLS